MELIYKMRILAELSSIAETICSIFRSPFGEYWGCDKLPSVTLVGFLAPGASNHNGHLKQNFKKMNLLSFGPIS
jgi:hypothetical protein